MLSKAFPDLDGWNWALEVQRAHRVTFNLKQPVRPDTKPCTILVYFGNILLRQAIYDKAKSTMKRSGGDYFFFVHPDFCHYTVERRWRLLQMIKPVQERGGQAYLLYPACLKVLKGDHTRFFTSEVKVKEYLQNWDLKS